MFGADWFQNASDIAAWSGLPVAFASLWYARKAVIIAQRKSDREDSNLTFYLENARYIKDDSGVIHEVVSLTVSNSSDAPNSVVKADLECWRTFDDGRSGKMRIPPVWGGPIFSDNLDHRTTNVPIDFAPRQSKRFDIVFPIRFDKSKISKSEDQIISIVDNFSKTYIVEINLVSGHV